MSEEHFLPPRAGKGILLRARVNAILDAAKVISLPQVSDQRPAGQDRNKRSQGRLASVP